MPTNHLNPSIKQMESLCAVVRRPTKTRKIYSCQGDFGGAVVMQNPMNGMWTLWVYERGQCGRTSEKADDQYEYKTQADAKFYGLSFVTTGGW